MEVGCEIEEPFQDSVRIFQMKRHRNRFFSCKIPSDSTDFCAFLVKDVEAKIAKFSSGKCLIPLNPQQTDSDRNRNVIVLRARELEFQFLLCRKPVFLKRSLMLETPMDSRGQCNRL